MSTDDGVTHRKDFCLLPSCPVSEMGGLGYAKNIVVLGFSDDAQLGRLRLVSGPCRAPGPPGPPGPVGQRAIEVIPASPVRQARQVRSAQQAQVPKDPLDLGDPRGLVKIPHNGEAVSIGSGVVGTAKPERQN